MHHLTLAALGSSLVAFGVLRLYTLYRRINHRGKVPGPTLLPYLGRIHDLPIKFMWLKLHEWGKKCRYIIWEAFFRTRTHKKGHFFSYSYADDHLNPYLPTSSGCLLIKMYRQRYERVLHDRYARFQVHRGHR